MNGIEQGWWQFEKWTWIAVMVVAGVMAFVYIAKIVAGIKEERRHKKIMKQFDK